MALPNIHEFLLREVVDYRQLNSNFTSIVDNMLKYVTATVSAYDANTRLATVLFTDGSTSTFANYTPFTLYTNDEVYVYYWTNKETDGYIGFKLTAETTPA